MRVSLFKVFHERGKVFLPGGSSILGLTEKDMNAIFRLATTGAGIVSLFSPLIEGDAHTAVFRGVFGDPVSARDLKGAHGISAGIKVNLLKARWVKSAVGLDCVG